MRAQNAEIHTHTHKHAQTNTHTSIQAHKHSQSSTYIHPHTHAHTHTHTHTHQLVESDFIELAFRKQFLQRGNIWRFQRNMAGRTAHLGQNVSVDGVQATIQELRCNG